MGITGSKVAKNEQKPVSAGSVPTTPILTPKVKKSVEEIIDPRSPSCSILRTPITSCASPFTPEANTCDTFNINSPALVKNLDDPRSPSCAFTRTPITAVEETDLLKRVQMRNLQSIKKVISDMPSQVPPKLLESSPIVWKPHENKRKSFAGLLETNLDYIETDLDVVILSKSSPSKLVSAIAKSPNQTELGAKFMGSVESTEKSQDPVSPAVEIPCTSTPVQTNESEETDDDIEVIEAPEENSKGQNLLVDDDGLIIIQRPTTPAPQDQQVPDVIPVTPRKVDRIENISATVQEFEKKVNHLIYTEEDYITSTPPVNKHVALQAKNASNRIPLGTRNGNNTNKEQIMAKNKSKLRVSDKPRRGDYAVSKIPVFNSKNKADCENTPPRNKIDERKVRRAQWDSDNTLII